MCKDVVLISMPWLDPRFPSPALGIIHALLEESGISVETMPLHLMATEYFSSKEVWESLWAEDESHKKLNMCPSEVLAYYTTMFGEYYQGIFAIEPLRKPIAEDEEDPLLFTTLNIEKNQQQFAIKMRNSADDFLNSCLDKIIKLKPKIVGFSVTFTTIQLVASLNLAKRIKQYDNSIKIVFGGGLADQAGEAIFKNFEFIDVLTRGHVDSYVVELFNSLLSDVRPKETLGICIRNKQTTQIIPGEAATISSLDLLPIPNYDNYFNFLDNSPLKSRFRDVVVIPFEASRGCWWGQKHQCKFCGLNMTAISFNAKSPTRVYEEILELTRRYKTLRLAATDCILDHHFFNTLMPMLEQHDYAITLTFEVKANLTKSQVAQLARSGVNLIQPGIESLSTDVLKLINKGVSALQNIKLLKWCQIYDIKVVWNVLYGFPGEDPKEYDQMALIIPSLIHFDPPTVAQPMTLVKHSPYYDDREQFSIEIGEPSNLFKNILNLDAQSVMDISPGFKMQPISNQLANANYAQSVIDGCRQWREKSSNNRGKLKYFLGPGFLRIDDKREGRECIYNLNELEALIYIACDDGACIGEMVEYVEKNGGKAPSEEEILIFLSDLITEGLMYREGDTYLSLAIPARKPNR